jgi:hypothetical protein
MSDRTRGEAERFVDLLLKSYAAQAVHMRDYPRCREILTIAAKVKFENRAPDGTVVIRLLDDKELMRDLRQCKNWQIRTLRHGGLVLTVSR